MTGVPLDIRMAVLQRAKFQCERCAGSASSSSVHHRKPRRMGGTRRTTINSPSNLILLCGTGTTGCHGWVESNRHSALADGYILHDLDDPGDHPVNLHDGWHWLLDDGTRSRNKPPVQ